MAFFTSLTCALVSGAETTTTPEGVPAYQFKAINAACNPGVPVILMVDSTSENGKFLAALGEKAAGGEAIRVFVSGILQPVLAEKLEDKSISKPPKVIVYVGGVRRMRADTKLDPEQFQVFGSGFITAQTDYEDSTKRKPAVFVSSGTESMQKEGVYCSRLDLIGDKNSSTEEPLMQTEDGTEVYFMGNLYRSAGTYNESSYDKLKVNCTFVQATDRVKQRKAGGRNKPASMTSQLDASFEESESTAQTLTPEALSAQAAVSLSDF